MTRPAYGCTIPVIMGLALLIILAAVGSAFLVKAAPRETAQGWPTRWPTMEGTPLGVGTLAPTLAPPAYPTAMPGTGAAAFLPDAWADDVGKVVASLDPDAPQSEWVSHELPPAPGALQSVQMDLMPPPASATVRILLDAPPCSGLQAGDGVAVNFIEYGGNSGPTLTAWYDFGTLDGATVWYVDCPHIREGRWLVDATIPAGSYGSPNRVWPQGHRIGPREVNVVYHTPAQGPVVLEMRENPCCL